jgi:hypothetical protein
VLKFDQIDVNDSRLSLPVEVFTPCGDDLRLKFTHSNDFRDTH